MLKIVPNGPSYYHATIAAIKFPPTPLILSALKVLSFLLSNIDPSSIGVMLLRCSRVVFGSIPVSHRLFHFIGVTTYRSHDGFLDKVGLKVGIDEM